MYDRFLTAPLVQQVEKGDVVAPLVGGTPDQPLHHLLRALQVFRAPQLHIQLRLELQALQLLLEIKFSASNFSLFLCTTWTGEACTAVPHIALVQHPKRTRVQQTYPLATPATQTNCSRTPPLPRRTCMLTIVPFARLDSSSTVPLPSSAVTPAAAAEEEVGAPAGVVVPVLPVGSNRSRASSASLPPRDRREAAAAASARPVSTDAAAAVAAAAEWGTRARKSVWVLEPVSCALYTSVIRTQHTDKLAVQQYAVASDRTALQPCAKGCFPYGGWLH